MSWTEKIKENIQITTGDGKSYSPLYFISTKSVEFNISKFDFPDINGTLVKRTTAMGATFSMDIIFQGEDNLDIRDEFEQSTLDNRPWEILHPIYGSLTVHPGSLVYDSTGLNTTVISGDYHETISDEYPTAVQSPTDEITAQAEQTNTDIIEDFTSTVIVDTATTTQMAQITDDAYSLGSVAITSGDQSNEYFDAFKEAESAIFYGIANASNMATKVNTFVNYPYQFDGSVSSRLNLFKSQFDKLSLNLTDLTSPKEKKTYEFSVLSIVNSMLKASILPQAGNYTNSNSVFLVIGQLLDVYNQMISNLDTLQTANNGTTSSYVPSFNSLNSLSNLVNYTIANLYTIALSAKQERKLILESDSNLIILTHRLYGIDPDNENIETFINTNSIGLNEYFEIKKGRVITYYV